MESAPKPPPPRGTTLREATIDDAPAACALLSRLGLGAPTDADAARKVWDHTWVKNPAYSLDRPHPPVGGWVLESEGGEVVGFFGNIPLRYRFGDRDILVACGSQWGVEKAYRIRTKDVAKAYFGQPNADVLLANTCNQGSGRIYDRFSALPMPVTSYARVLFWVFDAGRFLDVALRRKIKKPLAIQAGSIALTPAVAAVTMAQNFRLGRGRAGLEPERIPLSAVGDEFDDLWARKITERPRFLAYRKAEDLRWHFETGDARGKIDVLRCRRAGRLDGYLILAHDAGEALGMARAKIVDMIADRDDEDVIEALLAAAADRARERGAQVLELVGFPEQIRAIAQRSRPFARSFPVWPYNYKAATAALGAQLLPSRAWYPTLYDGDASL